jgi:hypothetical protein
MADPYVEILQLPGPIVEQCARLPAFEEAIAWLDARGPYGPNRRGRFYGPVTSDQDRILTEKGYGPG